VLRDEEGAGTTDFGEACKYLTSIPDSLIPYCFRINCDCQVKLA
jgi:hypothetical protein